MSMTFITSSNCHGHNLLKTCLNIIILINFGPKTWANSGIFWKLELLNQRLILLSINLGILKEMLNVKSKPIGNPNVYLLIGYECCKC